MVDLEQVMKRILTKSLKCEQSELRNYLTLLFENPKWGSNDELIEHCVEQITKKSFEFQLFQLQNFIKIELLSKTKEEIVTNMIQSYEQKFEIILKKLLKSDSYDTFLDHLALIVILRSGIIF